MSALVFECLYHTWINFLILIIIDKLKFKKMEDLMS